MGLDMYVYRIPKVKTIDEFKQLDKAAQELINNNPEMGTGELFWNIQRLQKDITGHSAYGMNIKFWVHERAPMKMELAPGITAMKVSTEEPNPKEFDVSIGLTTEVAYWRKFNALHRWMVENVQDGEDDCDIYLFTKDHAEQLRDLLNYLGKEYMTGDIKKANELADDLFPTQSGSFFGNTEYDEYYWENARNTYHTMCHLLKNWEDYLNAYAYQSSW